jgi:hypothetical protein
MANGKNYGDAFKKTCIDDISTTPTPWRKMNGYLPKNKVEKSGQLKEAENDIRLKNRARKKENQKRCI